MGSTYSLLKEKVNILCKDQSKLTLELATSSGTSISKSLTDHSAVIPVLLTYISVPTLIEDHTRLAGSVPGSRAIIICFLLVPYNYIVHLETEGQTQQH